MTPTRKRARTLEGSTPTAVTPTRKRARQEEQAKPRALVICAQEEPQLNLYTVLTTTLTPEVLLLLRGMEDHSSILHKDIKLPAEDEDAPGPLKASVEELECGAGWPRDLMDVSTHFQGPLILSDWSPFGAFKH